MMVYLIQVALCSMLWAAGVATALNATITKNVKFEVLNSTDKGDDIDDLRETSFKFKVGVDYQNAQGAITVTEKVWLETLQGNPVCNTRYAMCMVSFQDGPLPQSNNNLSEACIAEASSGDVCFGPISLQNASDLVNLNNPHDDTDSDVETTCRSLLDIEPAPNCNGEATHPWDAPRSDVLFEADTDCEDGKNKVTLREFNGVVGRDEAEALRYYDNLVLGTVPVILVAYGSRGLTDLPMGLKGSYAWADAVCANELNVAEGSRIPGVPGSPDREEPPEDDAGLSSRNVQLFYVGTALIAASMFLLL